jgi:hypothetical protein
MLTARLLVSETAALLCCESSGSALTDFWFVSVM